jgi:hypothetical protein
VERKKAHSGSSLPSQTPNHGHGAGGWPGLAARREIALTTPPIGPSSPNAWVPPPRQAQKWPRTPAVCVAAHPGPAPFASAGVGSVGGAVRCGWEGGTDWQLLLLRQAAAAPLARPRGPGPWCGGGAWPRPPNERANAMGGGGGGAHDGHVPLLSGRAAANGDPSKFLRRVPIHLQLRLGICMHHQESPPLVMLLQASAGVRSLIYHPSA